jgi:recombinational DNA repair protein (RecF pathway)
VFDACTHCGAATVDDAGLRFSPADGGVVCRRCLGEDGVRAGRSLSREALQVLSGPELSNGTARLAPAVRREIGIHLHLFLAHHLPAYRLPSGLDLLRAARSAPGSDGGEAGEDDS